MTPAWDQVGYSEDGWTLEVDKTFEDVMVAEELDPIKTLKSAQEVRLTGELAQASLTNFQVAMGGGSTQSNELGAGASGAAGTSVTGYHTFTPPTSDFSWQGNCTDTNIVFNDLSFSNISSWQWNFGDGGSSSAQNPQYAYATAGSYNISLDVTDVNGCTSSYSNLINIDSAIILDLGNDSSQCGGSIFIDESF